MAELLGLALRARKVAWGSRAVREDLRKGRAYLVIITEDASPRLRREFELLCRRSAVPLVVWGTKAELGLAMGKPPSAVAAVEDPGFARLIGQVVG
ncbi:MAG: ribosomal L7Ae/L30e/S12e/Gadd45 family protein [Thermoanaerobacteraceae bacterium]|uniref:L7Ae/L30e/S12e/Gadd45 family ribosomal protein n=1 Tax=Thermanaeromonas sp. C210 TaxID=2731925 RepID=UPI00155D21B1|nr:L7Ae/L30e/S12e/Gadd45 family ribosomal protein [Thermanaeromonas sp. C210]MBE3581590.1 ribosomal L7Ae/L30e/S12e/Gadd45 family protein [Thermoanaerobacteraceae bacterium]GFN23843.1 50S ribosomal protein L7ae [Thermanaeromonas sp. C210]